MTSKDNKVCPPVVSTNKKRRWKSGVSMSGGRFSTSPLEGSGRQAGEKTPLLWQPGNEENDVDRATAPQRLDSSTSSSDDNRLERVPEDEGDCPDGPPVYQTTTTTTPPRKGGQRRDSSLSSQLLPPSSDPTATGGDTKGTVFTKFTNFRKLDFTKRQWTIMVILCLVTLTSSFAVCLFPPFFPKIAQTKGASATVYGVIIGTNCLVAFFVTPSVGKNLERIGVKFAFVGGAFVSGGCCILSGFLEWFPPGWLFIVEAVCIRAVHACSNAFVITSTFAFIVVEFPNSIAKLFALTRTTMNLAQMLGPILGGALYEVGGFKLPFLVLGSVQILVSLICIRALPNYRPPPRAPRTSSTRTVTLLQVLLVPSMWVSFTTFIFSTMSNGFLSILLEPLVLRQFNISHLHVGFLFGLKDGANSLASPFWGYLCDRMRHVRVLILVSSLLAVASFVLLGPFPGLPLVRTETVVVVALLLNGFGIGGQQVAGVVNAMNEAVDAGFPNEAATHGFIAGLWSSLSGAGRFISRSGCGVLVDHIGFRRSTAVVVCLHVMVIAVTGGFMIGERLGVCERRSGDGMAGRRSGSGGKCGSGQCTGDVCVCQDNAVVAVIGTSTPSESLTNKAVTMPIPGIQEDLEGSMVFGSVRAMSFLTSVSPRMTSVAPHSAPGVVP